MNAPCIVNPAACFSHLDRKGIREFPLAATFTCVRLL